MRKNNYTIATILAVVFAMALAVNVSAQNPKGGCADPNAKCLATTVWDMLGIPEQQIHSTTALVTEMGTVAHYSKEAITLMNAWGVKDKIDHLVLTKASNGSKNILWLDDDRIPREKKNLLIYVVRYDDPKGKELPHLRVVCYEAGGTVSQAKIFDEGKKFAELGADAKKSTAVDKGKEKLGEGAKATKDALGGAWNKIKPKKP